VYLESSMLMFLETGYERTLTGQDADIRHLQAEKGKRKERQSCVFCSEIFPKSGLLVKHQVISMSTDIIF